MTQLCAQGFPGLDPADLDPVDVAEVERVWDTPLPDTLILVGGVDQRGWARACRIPDDPAGLFDGEYRDRQTWYRGRFALRAADDGDVPPDALESHYLSHFDQQDGLVLYPLGDPAPPVRRLLLVPVDPRGYATAPSE
ncbi:MAG: hypothetical protein AAGE03_06095 [Pseudomonadota bacterium]